MYNGYLRDHVEQIRTLHECGATTREIAESLYLAGARANTSEPAAHSRVMSREHHIANLQTMALFVLQRLGLRRRRVRVLNLKAAERVTKLGAPSRERPSDSDDPLAPGRNKTTTPCPYPTIKT
jgi:hypothetical protein